MLGKDRSSSANRIYRWGFKGRFDEATAKGAPEDLDCINEESRAHYYQECSNIIDILNQQIAADQPRLRAPDPKFNRQIGQFAGKTFSMEGDLLSEAEYREHLKTVLPQPQDLGTLVSITRGGDWLAGETLH